MIEKCLYIIELLSKGKPLSLKDINEYWSYSSLYGGEIIPKTLNRYKEYISNAFAIDIEYNLQSWKYVITNPEFMRNNNLHKYLVFAFYIQGLVELSLSHKEQVLLEDVLSGVEHLHALFASTDRNVFVYFDYHSFNKKKFIHQQLIPCFLKTLEQRWYLITEPLSRETPSVYALERRNNIRLGEETLILSTDIQPQTYFEGGFGKNYENCPFVLVTLKVYVSHIEYVKAHPINEYQQEVEQGDEWTVICYWVRFCYNFFQALLWKREKVEG